MENLYLNRTKLNLINLSDCISFGWAARNLPWFNGNSGRHSNGLTPVREFSVAETDGKISTIVHGKELVPALLFNMMQLRKDAMELSSGEAKMALFLSGGRASSILAKIVPEGTLAVYIDIEDASNIGDLNAAKEVARLNKLLFTYITITKEDYLNSIVDLTTSRAAPIHWMEPAIFTAARIAMETTGKCLNFYCGAAADIVTRELVNRFSMNTCSWMDVLPKICPPVHRILSESIPPDHVFTDNFLESGQFLSNVFMDEILVENIRLAFANAVTTAGGIISFPYDCIDGPAGRLDTLPFVKETSQRLYGELCPLEHSFQVTPDILGKWEPNKNLFQKDFINNPKMFNKDFPETEWRAFAVDTFVALEEFWSIA